MSDSRTKRQLEFVAVETPKSDACKNANCDGHIEWLEGRDFPKCDRCSQRYCFAGVRDSKPAVTDAQTIAMLEGVAEAAKRGAARGAGGKPKDIAEVEGAVSKLESVTSHGTLRVGGVRFRLPYPMVENLKAAINKACEGEVNTDAKTIADFEAEVKTLSETISEQTRQLAEQKPPLATPAPPGDSREAFEEWAKAIGYSLGLDGESYCSSSTRAALHGWNSAFGWRGSKPGKIAEAFFVSGKWHVYVGKHDIATCVGEVHANTVANLINKAHGCEEATDG